MPANVVTLTATGPDIEEVRAQFPALQSGFAYLENAGGSQVPAGVSDAMRDYMRTTYVQLGAGYAKSQQATETVEAARRFGRVLVNADEAGQLLLGPSTTAFTHLLAGAYAEILKPGDEVIVAETNHEANAGPWARLERFGVRVRIWNVDTATFDCPIETLEGLLYDRTRIVAIPHVSNLVGRIADARAIADRAHRVGARVVVDGVAFAPHRAVDVQALDADWYVFSMYKVYGPHMAVLYGKREAFDELTGPNHFFIAKASPYKFELGGVSHEACAGMLGVRDYLAFLGGREHADRTAVEAAFAHMEALERPAHARLLQYLGSRPDVHIIGPREPGPDAVPTVSFLSDRLSSDVITAHTDRRELGIRHGHMYAYRLCQALGIPTQPGVVRVSLAHYNTVVEIDRLIEALDEVL